MVLSRGELADSFGATFQPQRFLGYAVCPSLLPLEVNLVLDVLPAGTIIPLGLPILTVCFGLPAMGAPFGLTK